MKPIQRAHMMSFRILMFILFADQIYISFSQDVVLSRGGYFLIVGIVVSLGMEFYYKRTQTEEASEG